MMSPDPWRPTGVRSLGVVGVLGGLVLLAAFIVPIPPAWNPARLVLFHAGAIAVAVAVHPWHGRVAPRLALAGAVPLVLANAWSISWILLTLGSERPFAGDVGLIGFYAGLAAWLADAWFGLCALRIGVLWRPATFVLAAGSLLAITGMDRLELTAPTNPTIFGPVSLLGIALNAVAWILLGTQIAKGRPRADPTAVAIPGHGVEP
ncbi:MAG: hypothetical protein ACLGIJ_03175 [Candidatus Limnocylindria bacterium]